MLGYERNFLGLVMLLLLALIGICFICSYLIYPLMQVYIAIVVATDTPTVTFTPSPTFTPSLTFTASPSPTDDLFGTQAAYIQTANVQYYAAKTADALLTVSVPTATATVTSTATRTASPTFTRIPSSTPQPRLLQNGIGITTGWAMNNGEMQVEAYCSWRGYGIDHNNYDWYCTDNGARVFSLSQEDFNEICRATYPHEANAYAVQDGYGSIPAYRWRCYSDR